MKIDNVILGILVIMFAAILIGDAILITYTGASEVISPNDVKGITGVTFVIVAIFIFLEARDKTKDKAKE